VRILVVDDEPALLRLVELYLDRLGYQVTACRTSEEALERAGSTAGEYSLVIVDLNLPGIPGLELVRRLRANAPGLPVLLCSGYGAGLSMFPPELRERAGVLQKPFVPAMLAERVRDLLSQP
jgi:DNA-binding response OmpR family regulator